MHEAIVNSNVTRDFGPGVIHHDQAWPHQKIRHGQGNDHGTLKSDWRCIKGFARKPDKLGHPWDMMRFISPTFDLWSLFSSANLVASGSLLQSSVSLVAAVQRGLTAALPQFLLQRICRLMAQSGLSETSACLSAFGAKRTCFGLWPCQPRS
jgi:hypothetical protein